MPKAKGESIDRIWMDDRSRVVGGFVSSPKNGSRSRSNSHRRSSWSLLADQCLFLAYRLLLEKDRSPSGFGIRADHPDTVAHA